MTHNEKNTGILRKLAAMERAFRRYQITVIAVLSMVLLALLLWASIRPTQHLITNPGQLDVIGRVAGIFKEIVYAFAVVVGGSWSYYVFVRCRTFRSRINIDIESGLPQVQIVDVAVIRFRIVNVGNVKIAPKKLEVILSMGRRGPTEIEFEEFARIGDLLADHYPANNGFRLEPKDQMIIDTPIHLPTINQAPNSESLHNLIRVAAILTDYSGHLWKEQRIIAARR